jgi:HAD superfamily hydrolase (TIGR01509 family)
MIKAIFWDNDGVLVDTEGIFFRANQEVLAGMNISLKVEQFEEISLARGESVLRLAANPGTDAFDKLRADRDTLYAELLTREPLVIDGVRDVLDALRGKYVMGIVTSSGHEHFEIIHRQTGLLPYFQFALTMKDCPYTKPHPGPYLKAIELSGFAPEECLVIEDSPRGLAAAASAGLRCIVIPSKLTRGCNFAGASKILKNIKDLPDALKEF